MLESSSGDVEWLWPTMQSPSLSKLGAFSLLMITVHLRKLQKCQRKNIGECSLNDGEKPKKKQQNESVRQDHAELKYVFFIFIALLFSSAFIAQMPCTCMELSTLTNHIIFYYNFKKISSCLYVRKKNSDDDLAKVN